MDNCGYCGANDWLLVKIVVTLPSGRERVEPVRWECQQCGAEPMRNWGMPSGLLLTELHEDGIGDILG